MLSNLLTVKINLHIFRYISIYVYIDIIYKYIYLTGILHHPSIAFHHNDAK